MITPQYVLDIFERIPASDLPMLSDIIRNNQPSALILKTFPVPPCCIRPSVRSTLNINKSNEDEISTTLSRIIMQNL